eukprot:NODE_608_length_5442_cov_0.955830.p5 type:complete len:251 gc:universal NODE_608_length_5442_cov_0.955830:4628-5380(+)
MTNQKFTIGAVGTNLVKSEFECVVSFTGDGTLNLNVEDLEYSNIIDLFNSTNEYVRQHKSILYKCQAGMSRSCAFLVAYFIGEKIYNLCEALKECKRIRPEMSINKGFIYQLQLYEKMGGVIDIWNPEYRKFKAWSNLKMRETGTDFENDFNEDPEVLDVLPPLPLIRCKNCRRKLAMYFSENDHQNCDGTISIEPLKWMDIAQKLQGKLNCPRCKSKVGSFIWQGRRCSCGVYVAPHLTLSSKKIDLIK